MTTVIFDGRKFAKKIETEMRERVEETARRIGRKLKLVSIYNPDHEPSRVYTSIKARMAEELGVEFSIFNFQLTNQFSISKLINELNQDKNVDGIMMQMPLTGDKKNDEFLISLIDPKKDVDGLNPESGVLPATARAVIAILGESLKLPIFNYQFSINDLISKLSNLKIVVIGSKGVVGSRIVELLKCDGMDQKDFNTSTLLRADVVIACTGQAGLIKPEMVKPGVVAIDVGYPKGDFDPATALVAGFFTPVPGGVGPVTVLMLFANLVDLV